MQAPSLINCIAIFYAYSIQALELFSYKAFVACSCSNSPSTGNIRYPWWMVILVTPLMLTMAVVQAAIDWNKLIMSLIGAIVSC